MQFLSLVALVAFAMVWLVSFLCWMRRYDRNFWLTCQHFDEVRCILPAFLAGMACVIGALVQNHLNNASPMVFAQTYWWILLTTVGTIPILVLSFQPFLKSKLHD